jgi:hypothetical protein
VGWVRIFIAVRRERFNIDKKTLLFSSFYLASFLEFFIRGAGYFTPGMFFLIVSVLYFISNKVVRKEISYETSH